MSISHFSLVLTEEISFDICLLSHTFTCSKSILARSDEKMTLTRLKNITNHLLVLLYLLLSSNIFCTTEPKEETLNIPKDLILSDETTLFVTRLASQLQNPLLASSYSLSPLQEGKIFQLLFVNRIFLKTLDQQLSKYKYSIDQTLNLLVSDFSTSSSTNTKPLLKEINSLSRQIVNVINEKTKDLQDYSQITQQLTTIQQSIEQKQLELNKSNGEKEKLATSTKTLFTNEERRILHDLTVKINQLVEEITELNQKFSKLDKWNQALITKYKIENDISEDSLEFEELVKNLAIQIGSVYFQTNNSTKMNVIPSKIDQRPKNGKKKKVEKKSSIDLTKDKKPKSSFSEFPVLNGLIFIGLPVLIFISILIIFWSELKRNKTDSNSGSSSDNSDTAQDKV